MIICPIEVLPFLQRRKIRKFNNNHGRTVGGGATACAHPATPLLVPSAHQIGGALSLSISPISDHNARDQALPATEKQETERDGRPQRNSKQATKPPKNEPGRDDDARMCDHERPRRRCRARQCAHQSSHAGLRAPRLAPAGSSATTSYNARRPDRSSTRTWKRHGDSPQTYIPNLETSPPPSVPPRYQHALLSLIHLHALGTPFLRIATRSFASGSRAAHTTARVIRRLLRLPARLL